MVAGFSTDIIRSAARKLTRMLVTSVHRVFRMCLAMWTWVSSAWQDKLKIIHIILAVLSANQVGDVCGWLSKDRVTITQISQANNFLWREQTSPENNLLPFSKSRMLLNRLVISSCRSFMLCFLLARDGELEDDRNTARSTSWYALAKGLETCSQWADVLEEREPSFGQRAGSHLTRCSASSERISSGQSLTLSSRTAMISSWAIKGAADCLLRSWQKKVKHTLVSLTGRLQLSLSLMTLNNPGERFVTLSLQ